MSAEIPWGDLAKAYGFLGNSLLKPMSQTATIGIDPGFWAEFPDFDDAGIRGAIVRCGRYADGARSYAENGGDAVERVSVEHTRLFVGPPSPAAAPWETMHRAEGASAGFGEPTFQMRRLLREAGLELHNENRQYEDHIGIELLYLSTRCTAMGEAADPGTEAKAVLSFIESHPGSWIASLRKCAEETYPDGYIAALLDVAGNLLVWHAAQIKAQV